MKKPDYPFTPKSTAYLAPGQFWPIPLSVGGFACGRVLQLREHGGRPDRRVFLAGLLDWHALSPPTTTSIKGTSLSEVGAMHVKHFKTLNVQIVGLRPLEKDGVVIPNFISPIGATRRQVWSGFHPVKLAETLEELDLPQLSTWGYNFISRLAEKKFGTIATCELIAAAATPKGTPGLTLEQAIALVHELNKRGMPVHSMESYERTEGQTEKPLRLDFSILGLDGQLNWEHHENIEIANELALRKLNQAKLSGAKLEVIVWS